MNSTSPTLTLVTDDLSLNSSFPVGNNITTDFIAPTTTMSPEPVTRPTVTMATNISTVNSAQAPPGQPTPPTGPDIEITVPSPKPKTCPDIHTIIATATITTSSTSSSTTIKNNHSNNNSGVKITPAGEGGLAGSVLEASVPGSVVRVDCWPSSGSTSDKSNPRSTTFLECRSDGTWNSTGIVCADHLDVSSYRLYFVVGGIVGGLVLFALCIIYCSLLRNRRKKNSQKAGPGDCGRVLYVDPYHVGDKLYRSTHGDGTNHYARSDITYAKPIVYSTYLNPSFYEDAYDRWRRQEQQVSEKLYDSPWVKPRGIQNQMETPGFSWSQTSLKALGDPVQMERCKHLPRAQLSVDHDSVRSNESTIGHDYRLHSQSSVESGQSLRRYPSMAATDYGPQAMIGQTKLTNDELSSSPLTDFDRDSSDGLTNF